MHEAQLNDQHENFLSDTSDCMFCGFIVNDEPDLAYATVKAELASPETIILLI